MPEIKKEPIKEFPSNIQMVAEIANKFGLEADETKMFMSMLENKDINADRIIKAMYNSFMNDKYTTKK